MPIWTTSAPLLLAQSAALALYTMLSIAPLLVLFVKIASAIWGSAAAQGPREPREARAVARAGRWR